MRGRQPPRCWSGRSRDVRSRQLPQDRRCAPAGRLAVVVLRARGLVSRATRVGRSRRARACLENRLQAPAAVIAYPSGDGAGMPPSLRSALEETGYRAGCLYGGGPNPVPFADRYRLSRLAMGPDSDLAAMVGATPAA